MESRRVFFVAEGVFFFFSYTPLDIQANTETEVSERCLIGMFLGVHPCLRRCLDVIVIKFAGLPFLMDGTSWFSPPKKPLKTKTVTSWWLNHPSEKYANWIISPSRGRGKNNRCGNTKAHRIHGTINRPMGIRHGSYKQIAGLLSKWWDMLIFCF